jgi:hypothetical protein
VEKRDAGRAVGKARRVAGTGDASEARFVHPGVHQDVGRAIETARGVSVARQGRTKQIPGEPDAFWAGVAL